MNVLAKNSNKKILLNSILTVLLSSSHLAFAGMQDCKKPSDTILKNNVEVSFCESGNNEKPDIEIKFEGRAFEKVSENPSLIGDFKQSCNADFVYDWIDYAYEKYRTGYFVIKMKQVYRHLCEELHGDNFLNLAFITKSGMIIELINPSLVTNYDELATIATTRDPLSLKYIRPEYLSRKKRYDTIVLDVVKSHGLALEHLKLEFLSSKKAYDKIALASVKEAGLALEYVNPKFLSNQKEYERISQTAVTNHGFALMHVRAEILSSKFVYDNLSLKAVNQTAYALEFVNPKSLSSKKAYDRVATAAVRKNGWAMDYVKPDALSSKEAYDKIAEIASRNKR